MPADPSRGKPETSKPDTDRQSVPFDTSEPGFSTAHPPKPGGTEASPTPPGPAPVPNLDAEVVLVPGARPVAEYVLVHLLGRGGFGEVWKATAPGDFQVALKFIRLDGRLGDAEMRALKLMKNIRHAHLVPMFGAWQRNNYLIIAMELGDRTLHEHWKDSTKKEGPGIPLADLLEYMREAAKGIDFLNERRHAAGDGGLVGIQHKDIKPQNLLLVGNTIKVADFGLAKMLEETVTNASSGMTPAYAAPEFFEGKATRWSDQYSLAVTYCQLRGGALPFLGNHAQMMCGHMMQPPDLQMLPANERPVVARALAKKPEERWPNCTAFVQALTASVASQADNRKRQPRRAPSSRSSRFQHQV